MQAEPTATHIGGAGPILVITDHPIRPPTTVFDLAVTGVWALFWYKILTSTFTLTGPDKPGPKGKDSKPKQGAMLSEAERSKVVDEAKKEFDAVVNRRVDAMVAAQTGTATEGRAELEQKVRVAYRHASRIHDGTTLKRGAVRNPTSIQLRTWRIEDEARIEAIVQEMLAAPAPLKVLK